MTHNEMIACIQAHRDGKKLQYKRIEDDVWVNPIGDRFDFNFGEYDYRIAPEPNKRLMTAKELAGKWIKRYESDQDLLLVTGCNNIGVYLNGVHWTGIGIKWLYTTTPADDSSWKSVEVEVSE